MHCVGWRRTTWRQRRMDLRGRSCPRCSSLFSNIRMDSWIFVAMHKFGCYCSHGSLLWSYPDLGWLYGDANDVLGHVGPFEFMVVALPGGMHCHWTIMERLRYSFPSNKDFGSGEPSLDDTNEANDICSVGSILNWHRTWMLHDLGAHWFISQCVLFYAAGPISLDDGMFSFVPRNDCHLWFVHIVTQMKTRDWFIGYNYTYIYHALQYYIMSYYVCDALHYVVQ